MPIMKNIDAAAKKQKKTNPGGTAADEKTAKAKQALRHLGLTPGGAALILAGAAIASFGIHNIHQRAGITEGGVIGMILLLDHWFGISPSAGTLILDAACYALAFRSLGSGFIRLSAISTISVAAFFRLWEQFPPMLPDLSAFPLAAAVSGGLFVGVGAGLVVRHGASIGGDDALALTVSKFTQWRISRSYLMTDVTVLLLSLSYIPASKIVYSLVTVTISSLLIDFIQNAGCPAAKYCGEERR